MTAPGTWPPSDGGLEAFGLTDVGRRRSKNEDHFLVAAVHKALDLQQTNLEDVARLGEMRHATASLLIVADGVGGVAGGELASGLAVATVSEVVAQAAGCFYHFDVQQEHRFLEQLEGAVRRAHEIVAGTYGGQGRGPATTLTMAAVAWPRAYIVHIGDSRCYYLRGERLRQVTRDQTMSEMLLDEGAITEEQAERSPLGNVLASAIGSAIDPTVLVLDMDPGDVLLLCTDGLPKHVSNDAIRDILVSHDAPDEACRALVDRALEGGGSDNVTVIVARRGAGPEAAASD